MLKPLTLALFLVAPLVQAEQCPWMTDNHINEAYPQRAPWITMAGGQGRCKFLSRAGAPSTLSLTQMVKASPEEAVTYVNAVSDGMAEAYQVNPLTAIGKSGVAVRQENVPGSRMLTLIGHHENIVVMAQLSFYGGVNEAEQASAVALTKETFVTDTGGGWQMPSQ